MTASKFRDPPCTRFEFTKGALLYGFLVRSKDPLVNPKHVQGGSQNFEAVMFGLIYLFNGWDSEKKPNTYGESEERDLHDALG